MKKTEKMGAEGKKMMGGSCSGKMGMGGGRNVEKPASYYTKGFVAGRKAGQK